MANKVESLPLAATRRLCVAERGGAIVNSLISGSGRAPLRKAFASRLKADSRPHFRKRSSWVSVGSKYMLPFFHQFESS